MRTILLLVVGLALLAATSQAYQWQATSLSSLLKSAPGLLGAYLRNVTSNFNEDHKRSTNAESPFGPGIPQRYTIGYLYSCILAGAGGCSACVNGKQNACSWIVDNTEIVNYPPKQESTIPSTGVSGVCYPTGLLDALINAYNLENPIFAGYIARYIFDGSSRCPVDPSKEPALVGLGISPLQTETVFSHAFESDWCQFPTKPWVVDRSAFTNSGFGFSYLEGLTPYLPFDLVNQAQQYCSLANSPNAFPHFINQLVTTGGKFTLKNVIQNNIFPSASNSLPRLTECAKLTQAAYCSQFCGGYNVDSGVFVDYNTVTRYVGMCGSEVEPFFAIAGTTQSGLYPELAALGTPPATLDLFNGIPASTKFFSDTGFAAPCDLGRPYVDWCHGECILTYSDPNNCGACGNVCQSCSRGSCL